MQTLTQPTPTPMPPAAAAAPVVELPLVVFTTVDQAWTTATARWLASRNVPIVLVAHECADEVMAWQEALGVRHPFVCNGGAALYIPAAYFPELTRIGRYQDGWNVVEFKAPYDSGAAVRLLASLFRVRSDQALIVALVDRWADRALLHEADVPVVVRSGDPEQLRLLESTPSAYLTTAMGTAGWCEAVQGTLIE